MISAVIYSLCIRQSVDAEEVVKASIWRAPSLDVPGRMPQVSQWSMGVLSPVTQRYHAYQELHALNSCVDSSAPGACFSWVFDGAEPGRLVCLQLLMHIMLPIQLPMLPMHHQAMHHMRLPTGTHIVLLTKGTTGTADPWHLYC
jgi:hypothetical protein